MSEAKPARLGDLAHSIKGRNAGASWLTFDIAFQTETVYRRVLRSNAITPHVIARLYAVPAADVRIYAFDPAHAIKVTIPRATAAGGVRESDYDGAQQFAPLLAIEVA